MITFGLAACSDGQPVFFNDKINDFENPNQSDTKNDKTVYNSLKFEIIEDIYSLPSGLQNILEQAKFQKGYLTFKGADVSNPNVTLIFISSGQKNTGGYNIEIESMEIQKENNQLNIVVRETSPAPGDMVIQIISYPFILFTVEGQYDSFKVEDMHGNLFELIYIEDIQEDPSENDNIDNEAKADALVERFINAINSEDSREILECLNPEMLGYYTVETVETAILDYKAYFKNSPIIQYRRISGNNDIPNSYTYQLISELGDTLEINIVYEKDAMWISCEFLDYSYQSKHLLERFVYALQKENELLLAQVLAIDDFDDPLPTAFEIMEKYREHFDLESVDYQFIGIDSKNNTFLYSIVGEKNDQPVEHPVKIIYEDGSVWLDDSWIPNQGK